jgi:hypothetical protein
VPNWSISRNYKNIWNSTKDSVTTGMFVTCRPRGAKPQVRGAQGPTDRPIPMVGLPHFESVQAETWWLRSYVGSQEYPMPESWWLHSYVSSQEYPMVEHTLSQFRPRLGSYVHMSVHKITLAPCSSSALPTLVCFLVFYQPTGKQLASLTDVVSGFKSFSEAPCLAWKCGTRRSDSPIRAL